MIYNIIIGSEIQEQTEISYNYSRGCVTNDQQRVVIVKASELVSVTCVQECGEAK